MGTRQGQNKDYVERDKNGIRQKEQKVRQERQKQHRRMALERKAR